MSRHLVIDDLSMVVIMADASTTQGPYDEDEEDYVFTSDMTAAAKAGSAGVDEDRDTVLGGVPFNLTLNIYDLSNSSNGFANEYEDVEVYLWHCDAVGIYSAVDGSRQTLEDTDGQMWLRAYQVTGSDGQVTFQTILPGWYTDRVIHFHVRLRFQGADYWAATSQFFVNDTARALYEDLEPYVNDSMDQTSLSVDTHYLSLDSDVAEMLVVNMQGSVETGFASSFDLGLLPSDEWESTDDSVGGGGGGMGGGDAPPGMNNTDGFGGPGGMNNTDDFGPGGMNRTDGEFPPGMETPAPSSTSTFVPTSAPTSPTLPTSAAEVADESGASTQVSIVAGVVLAALGFMIM
eukprot:Nitzschia sp. Nitz4//scaffold262_size27079//25283//26323//NITZ4_P3/40-3//-1//CDS//3329544760//6700//frame0